MPSILVTGASRGIGAAIAGSLANADFVVGCISRTGTAPTPSPITDRGRARLIALQADVTDPKSLQRAFSECERLGGEPIVGLVNNAGVHDEARSQEMSRIQWDTVMNTNALATVFGCQAAYPLLVANGGGLIVNIGSFFDKLGVKRNLAYCASKAAVGAITRVLAVEWAKVGIRVIDVAPGYVETDLNRASLNEGPLAGFLKQRIPRGKPGSTDEVAAFVAMLFTSNLHFLTGETVYIDGGQGHAL
jgi:NAD(P)-dependent dehydrogenase (short-subunit alcohol dehydrogenase family)